MAEGHLTTGFHTSALELLTHLSHVDLLLHATKPVEDTQHSTTKLELDQKPSIQSPSLHQIDQERPLADLPASSAKDHHGPK